MSRAKLLVLGLGLALIAIIAAPAASAQDGPTITVDPTNVEAAGDTEFTIIGAGFTATPPLAIVPCFDAATIEELTEAGIGACDTGAVTLINELSDGGFTTTVTYAVPEAGMCIAGGDLTQTETAPPICITVGAAEEATAEETTAEETTAEETTEEGGEEELAVTGAESTLLTIIAVAVLGAGAMAVGYTRRFS